MSEKRLREMAAAYVDDAVKVISRNIDHVDQIARISTDIIRCFDAGRTVFICGNGGSAADAEHIAGEYVGRVRSNRRPLPCVALTAGGAAISGIGNDFGFEEVFARQVRAAGRPGDILILLSTSGASRNVLLAADAARARGMATISFSGNGGGPLAGSADLAVVIDSGDPERIQEAYLNLLHIVAALVEDHFSAGN